LSKIHAGDRLSGPLGSGNRSIAAVLELVALNFCANFSRLSEFAGQVKKKIQDFFSLPLQRQTLKDHSSRSY